MSSDLEIGTLVYIFDMYGGIIKGEVASASVYKRLTERFYRRGIGSIDSGSLAVSYGNNVGVFNKKEVFRSYEEALVYRIMNS